MSKRRTPFEILIIIIFFPIILLIEIIKLIIKAIKHSKQKKPKQQKNKIENNNEKEYILKQSLMTQCEKEYFRAIRPILPIEYILQPQINLASIIEKTPKENYANELFRNIDFGIFNKEYKPIALIEINDRSHEEKSRQERDIKVKEICNKANITIITLWTKYGINTEYIRKQINEVTKSLI